MGRSLRTATNAGVAVVVVCLIFIVLVITVFRSDYDIVLFMTAGTASLVSNILYNAYVHDLIFEIDKKIKS